MAPDDETTRTTHPAPEVPPPRVVVVPPGGDTTRLGAVYEKHDAYVMKLLLARKDIPPESKKDICQLVLEAFTRLDHEEKLAPDARETLRRITRNEVRKYKRRWRPRVEDGRDPAEMASREADPEGAAAAAERRRLLEVYLQRMPPEAAELIRYVNIYGMSVPEVAAIRKVPVNTATSQHARAVEKLKALARDDGQECDV